MGVRGLQVRVVGALDSAQQGGAASVPAVRAAASSDDASVEATAESVSLFRVVESCSSAELLVQIFGDSIAHLSGVCEAAQNMTTKIIEALRTRYPLPVFATFYEVADKTGGACGYADAIVVGCWPSRGLDITGFEFKCDRRDWINELKNPAKAERFARFCDYWFLVQGEKDIVAEGELPKNWGLLTLKGAKLSTTIAASKLEPEPTTKRFLASLLRSAVQDSKVEEAFRDGLSKGREEARKRHKDDLDLANRYAEQRLRELRDEIAKFEKVSGISIASYGGENIGAAVARVLRGDESIAGAKHLLAGLERASESLRAVLPE